MKRDEQIANEIHLSESKFILQYKPSRSDTWIDYPQSDCANFEGAEFHMKVMQEYDQNYGQRDCKWRVVEIIKTYRVVAGEGTPT